MASLTDGERSLVSIPTPPGGPLRAVVHRDGPDAVLALSGEIDIATADLVRAAVNEGLRQPRPRSLTFDLSAVTFCDCSGIEVLEWALERVRDTCTQFRLCGVTARLRRTFSFAHADELLDASRAARDTDRTAQ